MCGIVAITELQPDPDLGGRGQGFRPPTNSGSPNKPFYVLPKRDYVTPGHTCYRKSVCRLSSSVTFVHHTLVPVQWLQPFWRNKDYYKRQ